jgi:hypothetical protein
MSRFLADVSPAYSRSHAARPVLLRRDRPRCARAPGSRGRCELRRVRGGRGSRGLRGGARARGAGLPRRAARGRAGRVGRLGAQRRPGDLRLRHEPGQPRRAGRHRIGAPDVGRLRGGPRLGARPRRAPRHRLRPQLGSPARGHPAAPARRAAGTATGTGRGVRLPLAALHGTQRRRGAARDDALLRRPVRPEERPPAPAQLHARPRTCRRRRRGRHPRGFAGHPHRAGRSRFGS